jgi:hypothetical protein
MGGQEDQISSPEDRPRPSLICPTRRTESSAPRRSRSWVWVPGSHRRHLRKSSDARSGPPRQAALYPERLTSPGQRLTSCLPPPFVRHGDEGTMALGSRRRGHCLRAAWPDPCAGSQDLKMFTLLSSNQSRQRVRVRSTILHVSNQPALPPRSRHLEKGTSTWIPWPQRYGP